MYNGYNQWIFKINTKNKIKEKGFNKKENLLSNMLSKKGIAININTQVNKKYWGVVAIKDSNIEIMIRYLLLGKSKYLNIYRNIIGSK